ncbi:MAG: NADH-quinone oxidoreductase subunit I [Verrucomicrobia bacterium]|nr:NADH-quinone oxidoreductase subunit I [Verrucomicrobiota bacterium]
MKTMDRPKLTFAERFYIPQIIRGLWQTLRHIPRKKITVEYPEVKPKLHGSEYRGVPTLVRDPDGRVKCVACQLCEFVCPPKAIRILPASRDAVRPDGNVEKEPEVFEIDMLRCIYCGLCEEACPEEAIFLRKDFAVTGYTRSNKQKLLELGGTHADRIWKWKNK